MKKLLLAIISVLIIMFSSVLTYYVMSDDSIEIDLGNEKEELSGDILDEIDAIILDEYDEIEIGEMI